MTDRSFRWVAVTVLALLNMPSIVDAQQGAFGGGFGPPLAVVAPPREYASSEEHYKDLLARAKGGTKHTITSVPRWDGLWVTAGNTHMNSFIDPPGFTGKVRPGVLTPPYEAAYKERWRQQQELGEVQYDRLTHCEPPGYPRFLLEPYSHEFINLPNESYLINDFGPSIRRVYIGQEHKNVYGTHSWYGDTIGFWNGNTLVTNTKYLLPADFTRWSPMTSNQFESVETWTLKQYPDGVERLEVQVTFYDKHAFVKPVNAVYAFRRAKELEASGHRVQHWECEGSTNDVFDKGGTTSRLPGEAGFKDVRGSTLFPDLPGQSRDPIYNTTLPGEKKEQQR
jgi:hypothetical protein